MKRPALLLGTLLVLSGCAQAPRCGSIDAKGVVAALKSKEQFRSFLKLAVSRTQTARMAEARDGSKARVKIAEAIDEAVERHEAEWEGNLVASWQFLSATEIAKVCTALAERDQEAFKHFAERVGPQVQSRNQPLLERAATEVLTAVW